ncbi:MAG: hypothetical protein ACE5GU_04915 [Candidatus Scalinduaceae bacterium]
MRVHSKHKKETKPTKTKKALPKKIPEWPNNIGKRRKITTIWGTKRHLMIEDEIIRKQSNAPHKLIVFQKIKLEEENRIEYRLGYYMIGVKKGAKGRWIWGQFCLLIPEKDLKAIMKEANRRKWF